MNHGLHGSYMQTQFFKEVSLVLHFQLFNFQLAAELISCCQGQNMFCHGTMDNLTKATRHSRELIFVCPIDRTSNVTAYVANDVESRGAR